MWIWIIGAVVVCCIIAGVAQASEDDEKKKLAAKRPDAFVRLFSEEFPDFSGNITFAKAEAAIKKWDEAIVSYDFTKHQKLFDKTKFKNVDSANQAMSYLINCVAKEISIEFVEYIQKNSMEASYAAMRRAMDSSLTLAEQ
ncbi:hypothetical protein DL239_02530 [Sedimentitalea sp. CY04]|uniref:SXP/RAL-2 family protein Ani s 5-like cation-binding domain-containing protein n=1 Tax=Parasedimentitalea denitrificans TaxID=2211118 RepID=A0ABX0W4G3_9RHOB|nr:hypothetical protein [Sedimentitalea sp. CY04]NIZ59848.1 hypothetical protein [Sedimentitalea sp. CY04]